MLGERSEQRGLWEVDRLYIDHVGRGSFYGLLASMRGQLFEDEEFAVSRAERNQAVWRSKSVPLERRCSAKMSAYDGCRREPLVAARLVEPMRQGNRWLSAW